MDDNERQAWAEVRRETKDQHEPTEEGDGPDRVGCLAVLLAGTVLFIAAAFLLKPCLSFKLRMAANASEFRGAVLAAKCTSEDGECICRNDGSECGLSTECEFETGDTEPGCYQSIRDCIEF